MIVSACIMLGELKWNPYPVPVGSMGSDMDVSGLAVHGLTVVVENVVTHVDWIMLVEETSSYTVNENGIAMPECWIRFAVTVPGVCCCKKMKVTRRDGNGVNNQRCRFGRSTDASVNAVNSLAG